MTIRRFVAAESWGYCARECAELFGSQPGSREITCILGGHAYVKTPLQTGKVVGGSRSLSEFGVLFVSLDNVPSNDEIVWLSRTSVNDDVPTEPPVTVEPVSHGGSVLPNSTETMETSSSDKVARESLYSSLDPRHIQAERVVALIVSICFTIPALVGIVVVGFGLGFTLVWLGVTAGILLPLVLLIVFMFLWPPISHRHVRWRLDEIGLEIQRGVYWRKTLSVPLARLQHADLTQGPIQRQWGLAKLTVYTAGTENASVELDGLAYETAVELRDRLLRQQGVGDVV